jgi:hypothetical protein
MVPKRKTTSHRRTAQEKAESSMSDYGTILHSILEASRGYGPELEMAQEGPAEVTMG